MPYKYKFVRERIGEKITDPSQLVGWRDRRLEREERERQAELERQRELERRRAAGEIIPEDDVPASTSTSATARRRNSFALRPETRPLTERPMTRTVARAIAMAATSDDASANTAIASTPAADDVEVEAPIFPSASSPTTASPAALPVVSAIDVDEEEPRDVDIVASRMIEPASNEDVQQQGTAATVTKEIEKPEERHSIGVSEPASPEVDNTPTYLQNTPTAVNTQASSPAYASVPSPEITQTTVENTATGAEADMDMGLLDPALFEPHNEESFAQQVSVPGVVNEKPLEPTVHQESEPVSQVTLVQAGNIPANRLTIVESATMASPTITIPQFRPVIAPPTLPVFTLATAPALAPASTPVIAPVNSPVASLPSATVTAPATALATTPEAVAALAVEVEHTAAKLPEPATGRKSPVQIVVPSAAAGNQQMTQPATGQSEARVKAAYQLVPVVDIGKLPPLLNALLQSPIHINFPPGREPR